jgi:hypothetical protein
MGHSIQRHEVANDILINQYIVGGRRRSESVVFLRLNTVAIQSDGSSRLYDIGTKALPVATTIY